MPQNQMDRDPSAEVELYSLLLKYGPNTYCKTLRPRRYAPGQRNFLTSSFKVLESVSAAKKKHIAKWTIPALAVPKSLTD